MVSCSSLLKVIVFFKMSILTPYFLLGEPDPPPLTADQIRIRYLLNTDPQRNQSYQIMDEPNVRFSRTPSVAVLNPFLTVMVLSANRNQHFRMRLRHDLDVWMENHRRSSSSGHHDLHIKMFFILGKDEDLDERQSLEKESLRFGDLLQISLRDEYTKLAYKSISGYLWVNMVHPQSRFVLKLDDDVRLNWSALIGTLTSKNLSSTKPEDLAIECPSVMRNMKPWRPKEANARIITLMSKWAVTREEMSRRVYPDFCPGWAYVLSPSLALKMAEVAASLSVDIKPLRKLDDIFLTGFVRERIAGSRVQQLDVGWPAEVWNHFLSECPFLGIWKVTFFNQYVVSKKYIDHRIWFMTCAAFEYFILDNVDYLFPGILPDFLIQICER